MWVRLGAWKVNEIVGVTSSNDSHNMKMVKKNFNPWCFCNRQENSGVHDRLPIFPGK